MLRDRYNLEASKGASTVAQTGATPSFHHGSVTSGQPFIEPILCRVNDNTGTYTFNVLKDGDLPGASPVAFGIDQAGTPGWLPMSELTVIDQRMVPPAWDAIQRQLHGSGQ